MATAAERNRDRLMRRRAPTYTAGNLNMRITLLRVSHDGNALPFLEASASRQDQGVREFWKDGTTKAETSSKFVVRWSPKSATVRPQDAIEHNGQRYSIRGITEVGRREWIEITAVRRTDMGE